MTNDMSYTKQAAAFGKLVGICAGYEGKYNPARQNLTINSIKSLEVKANAANLAVDLAAQNWSLAASTRLQAFNALLDDLIKLRGDIISSDLDPGAKKLLLSAIRKVRGGSNAGNTGPPAEEGAKVSISRRSTGKDFASRSAGFDQLINLLSTTSGFVATTPGLSPEALNKKATEIKVLSTAVTTAYAELQDARSNRRQVFKKPFTGVLATGAGVKYAVASIFGRKSDELSTIKSVRF